MRARTAFFFALLTGCTQDPAELVVSAIEPATANAQYFHGNCFAGFGIALDLRVQETRRVSVLLSRFAYRLTDRGTGQSLADEDLNSREIDERYGERASSIPAGATKVFRIGGVSHEPLGPLSIAGELAGMDENDRTVVASFDLSVRLEVSDPGPPESGACAPP
jgi:hypothetical protein